MIDDARSVFYTLQNHKEISVYHITSKDSAQVPKFVARMKDICRIANFRLPNTGMLNASDFKITWLGVTSEKESKGIHLVAMTSHGVRLYFTHSSRGYGYGSWSSTQNTPNALELVAVRAPPPKGLGQTSEGGMIPYQLQMQTNDFPPQHPGLAGAYPAFYSDGIFIAASPYNAEPHRQADNIFCVARSAQRLLGSTSALGGGVGPREELTDTATDLLIAGQTRLIAEARNLRYEAGTAAERISPLASQMIRPARVFLLLTNTSLVVLAEQRPVDNLRALLELGNAPSDQSIRDFANKYGLAQTMAMSLAIASRNSQLSVPADAVLSTISSTSTISGGTAHAGFSPRHLSQEAASRAFRIFFDSGSPRYEPAPFTSSGALSEGRVIFSPRHDGLAIYASRLMRLFWNEKIAKKAPLNGEPNRLDSNLDTTVLTRAQLDLQQLHLFIQRHASFLGIDANVAKPGGVSEDERRAVRAEQDSMSALAKLIGRTLEALSFVLLLIDYKMPAIIARCRSELQSQLLSQTYADLITSQAGRDVARGLVEAVIDAQIASQVSIDAVADVLQERCGSFCNADDVRLYKALEALRRAKEATDASDRFDNLHESLRLLLKSSTQLPFEKLKAAVTDYTSLRFPQGSIQLPLQCAQLWDPKGLASAHYYDGRPASSSEEVRKAFEARSQCYDLILQALASFDDALDEAMNVKGSNTYRQTWSECFGKDFHQTLS